MKYYIIIRGPLGCGKSTVAKEIARKMKGKYVSIDAIIDKNKLYHDKEQGYISQASFIKANSIAIKYLKKAEFAVFDGNFYWKSQIENLVNSLNCEHKIFTLKASIKKCIERDSKRIKSYGKDATKLVYKKSTEFDYGEIIDTERQTEKETINEILEKIS